MDFLKEEKEKFKKDGKRGLYSLGVYGFISNITKSKFDFRFKIVDPGIEID
ncbi:MAG TPA: hypothetical protein P5513_04715 [Candidatus Diapherotrites archaeon]|nr:hypothetical protein [Candidatus Diapherotrites archaeon]